MKFLLSDKFLKHRYWFTAIRLFLVAFTLISMHLIDVSITPNQAKSRSLTELVVALIIGIVVGALLQARASTDVAFIDQHGFNLRKWFMLAFDSGHPDFFSAATGWAVGVGLLAWLNHDVLHLVAIPGYVMIMFTARVGVVGPLDKSPVRS